MILFIKFKATVVHFLSISVHTKYRSTKTVCCLPKPHEKISYSTYKSIRNTWRRNTISTNSYPQKCGDLQSMYDWKDGSTAVGGTGFLRGCSKKYNWLNKRSVRKACLHFSLTWRVEWPLGPGRNKWSVLSRASRSCQSSSQRCNAMWGCTFCQTPAEE